MSDTYEKLVLQLNEDTFSMFKENVLNGITLWLHRENTLKDFFFTNKHNPNVLTEFEETYGMRLSQIFQTNFNELIQQTSPPVKSLVQESNLHTLGNGSTINFNMEKSTLTWVNTNSHYSGDVLNLLALVDDYKLWPTGTWATWQKGKGSNKIIKTYGWKSTPYKRWYKNSLKLD